MTNHENAMEKLQSAMPEVMKAFTGLHDEVLKDGAISVKHKRLMLTAISVALRCESCLHKHMGGAIAAGATREEVMEAAGTGMLMAGGPGVAFCSNHLVDIYDKLDADNKKAGSA